MISLAASTIVPDRRDREGAELARDYTAASLPEHRFRVTEPPSPSAKAYDTEGFARARRERNVTPHGAAKTTGSALDRRTTRHLFLIGLLDGLRERFRVRATEGGMGSRNRRSIACYCPAAARGALTAATSRRIRDRLW